MGADQFIAARVSSETKARLKAVAAREQISESALIKRVIELAVPQANPEDLISAVPPPQVRSCRITIRIRPEDLRLLQARAQARGMASATYISVMVRAHLRSLAPLPRDELIALKSAIAELSAWGRNLNQIVRAITAGTLPRADLLPPMEATIKVCTALHAKFKELLQANLRSWKRGSSDEKSA